MNSIPNSDSECALSQDWVGCTGCTPRTQAARPLRAGLAVSWHTVVVSWHTVAVSWLPSRSYPACALPYRGRVTGRTRALARRVATPFGHDTKNCIATLAPTAHCVARAAARVAAPLHRVVGCWVPYRSPWRTVSPRQVCSS